MRWNNQEVNSTVPSPPNCNGVSQPIYVSNSYAKAYSDDKIEQVRVTTAHLGGPVPQLAFRWRTVLVIDLVSGRDRGRGTRCPPMRKRLEQLRVFPFDPRGIEAPGRTQLCVNVSSRMAYDESTERDGAKWDVHGKEGNNGLTQSCHVCRCAA